MVLLGIIEEDFVNYKKVSMTLEFPTCSFKCNRDAGKIVCHNFKLAKSSTMDFNIADILDLYVNDNLTEAIVCQGLEPLDSFDDVIKFLSEFRKISNDDFVIYTGYELSEIDDKVEQLICFDNVLLKVGRFIPDLDSKFDAELGVTLASSNQYAIALNDLM